jgi:signal transduction histidine kinase
MPASAVVAIVIEDNGRGLPVEEPISGHDGLVNIRSRMERLGGGLRRERTVSGNLLRLVLPCRRAPIYDD